ncbi:MAG: efflux RND transporter periplasmic adaptor subunit [Candidatus Riflebacteria bacterium]|nr:efflux RND transporter periplasmic adaptor subunit [Candidatus Riflebacteria bacterium]
MPICIRKYTVIFLLAFFMTFAAIPGSLFAEEEHESAASEPVPIVKVTLIKIERKPIAEEVSTLGTVFPSKQAVISAKIPGQLQGAALLSNKSFNDHDLIATLESRDLQAQRDEAAAALKEALITARGVSIGTIPQAEAQAEKDLADARATVANASATYGRRQTLFDLGGLPGKDLDASRLELITAQNNLRLVEKNSRLRQTALNANDREISEARVSQARHHLETLESQLSYAEIRAPFSGVITEQFQFDGEFVVAGTRLFTIADLQDVIVKAPFADTVVAKIHLDDPATVLTAGTAEEELTGRISLISRSTDPLNRTIEVWIAVKNENGKLRANGAAKVVVATRRVDEALVAPLSAILRDEPTSNNGKVIVVDDKLIAHERKVVSGIQSGASIQIVSGVKEGEMVVGEGSYSLVEGTKVQTGSSTEEKSDDEAAEQSEKKKP